MGGGLESRCVGRACGADGMRKMQDQTTLMYCCIINI